MPTSSQGTVVALSGEEYGTGTRSKGSSDTTDLAAAYPNSILDEAMTVCATERNSDATTLKGWYQANVLDGVETKNTLTGDVDMNYGTSTDTAADLQPPNLEADLTDTEGTAVNSYVPDVSAEAAAGVYPDSGHLGSLGSITSPSATSTTMSEQDISNLPIKGKSEVPVETSSS